MKELLRIIFIFMSKAYGNQGLDPKDSCSKVGPESPDLGLGLGLVLDHDQTCSEVRHMSPEVTDHDKTCSKVWYMSLVNCIVGCRVLDHGKPCCKVLHRSSGVRYHCSHVLGHDRPCSEVRNTSPDIRDHGCQVPDHG